MNRTRTVKRISRKKRKVKRISRKKRKVKRISRKKSRKKGGAFSLLPRNDPDEITIKDRNIGYLQLLPEETETQNPSPNWVYKVIGSHRKGLKRNKYLKVQKESTDDIMPIYEILKSNTIEHERSHAVAPISWRTGGEI